MTSENTARMRGAYFTGEKKRKRGKKITLHIEAKINTPVVLNLKCHIWMCSMLFEYILEKYEHAHYCKSKIF